MPAGGVVEQARAIVERIVSPCGLDIYDVQFRREGNGMVLRVLIDRRWEAGAAEAVEDGVSVEDCARVSRDLSAVLDVEDIIPTAYTLEVSSPGLDRPLRTVVDYQRFSGRRAKLVVRQAVDGAMFFKGRLDGLAPGDAPAVTIVTDDDRRHSVPLGLITRANLEVEF